MHRTNLVPRVTYGLLLLGLALFLPGRVISQEVAPPPRPDALDAQRGTAIYVPVNGSYRLQMTGKKVIRTVVNSREDVANVEAIKGDPTTVLIQGRQAGNTKIRLTAADGTEENYDVTVQIDVEFLRSVLQRTVPTAQLNLIPASTTTIIVAGTVNHSEDIDIIMNAAYSVVGQGRAINALRVGGVVQVQLDVVVAYVSRGELRRMSFDFLNDGSHHTFASTPGGALTIPSTGISGVFPGMPTITNNVGSPNGIPANFFLGLFNHEQDFFGFLEALRNENLAKILSQPKLVTISGRSATLLSGGEQAIPEAQGLGTTSVRFVDFGTRLSFLPIVLGNGKIQLEVEPEISNIDPTVGTSINGTVVPGRNTQRVHTVVEIEDGQTLAIGGLIQHDVVASAAKVPVLGDLPFVGPFFSSKAFNETERELVVMVTPHLVDPQDCSQVTKLLPGQETRTPDDFELFLEGILEAPRGQREVNHDRHYVPAWKNGPSADLFPCCGDGACGSTGYAGHEGGCAACGGMGLANSSAIGYSSGASVKTESKTGTVVPASHSVDMLPPAQGGDMGSGAKAGSR